MRLEKVVVAPGDLLDGLGKEGALLTGEVGEGPDVPLGDDENLEWPDRPPGADDQEAVVLEDDSLVLLQLDLDVVRQEVSATVFGTVFCHLFQLRGWLLGSSGRRPDLAVGMGVGAAHGGALVLENLHVAELVLGSADGRLGRER